MLPAMAGRIPLVRRTKAPALPLEERVNHLTGLTVAPAGAGHHDLVARTCGILNYAALIATDVGLPHLAADLCWRQHQVFADAGRLSGPIAVMSLMPLVNLSRLLTRDGQGDTAYDLLVRLNHAVCPPPTSTAPPSASRDPHVLADEPVPPQRELPQSDRPRHRHGSYYRVRA